MNGHFMLSAEMENKIYKEELIKLGKRIRELRKARNKTQLDLEFDCKINHGDISRIENGQSNLEFFTIVRLAVALNVKLTELFKEDLP
ncbi:MAG: helix-turn-helix transcriptional regulator [Flavitalea sp.]